MAWSTSNRASRLPSDWALRRANVLKRDGHLCQIRGPRCTLKATEIDHILHGDNHSRKNLQAVCSPCHASKSSSEGAQARIKMGSLGFKRKPEQHPGFL